MDTKIFREWPFWVVIGLFFLSTFLMIKIESWMVDKNTLYPALVFLLPAIAWFFLFVKPTIKK